MNGPAHVTFAGGGIVLPRVSHTIASCWLSTSRSGCRGMVWCA